MKNHVDPTSHSIEALLDDLRALVAELENLAAQSAARGGDAIENLRERVTAAQERLGHVYAGTRSGVIKGAKNADRIIRANPYSSLAAALGAGVLLGLFLGRRK